MNNEEKIEIEFDVTAQDYRRILFWYHWKSTLALAIIYLIGASTMIWLVTFGAGGNSFDVKIKDVFLIFGFFTILPILIGFSFYFSIFKQAKKIEKICEKAIILFDENGVESKSETTSSKMNWERFAKIYETKTDFIFFPQENLFYPIPKRFFKNAGQIDDFKKLITVKLGANAKLKTNL
ncbi:MAG: YcxB family protein [Actinomycetota bacterium]